MTIGYFEDDQYRGGGHFGEVTVHDLNTLKHGRCILRNYVNWCPLPVMMQIFWLFCTFLYIKTFKVSSLCITCKDIQITWLLADCFHYLLLISCIYISFKLYRKKSGRHIVELHLSSDHACKATCKLTRTKLCPSIRFVSVVILC